MSFQMHGHHSYFDKGDLEGGKAPAISEDTGLLTCHSYLFERGIRPSWMLFGCCTLVGLINVLSILLTLAETTNLKFSDILIKSNALLLSTGFLISLFSRIHSSRCQPAKERNRPRNELSSRVKLCIVGSFCTISLSPALACLILLEIYWFSGHEIFSPDTAWTPLVLSWATVNMVAALLIVCLDWRRKTRKENNYFEGYASLREEIEDYDVYEDFDETDGPTFLPQQIAPAYYDLFGRHLNQETEATCTFAPNTSWEGAVELPEALRELVRRVISIPEESLPPSAALELLVMAAISIGVCLDGMGSLNQDTQYTYLMSRTCDRLAEIFQQAHPSAVPEHAMNVFLLVDQFEQFDGVDVAVLDADNGYISALELKRVVRCLKSRSASLFDC